LRHRMPNQSRNIHKIARGTIGRKKLLDDYPTIQSYLGYGQ